MIFLRPWFLLLLFVPVFFWWWRQKRGGSATPWQKYISAELLPYVTVSNQTDKILQKRGVSVLLSVLWSLGVLALSGPAVDKLPVPLLDTVPATVIIADLNSLNEEKTNLLQVKLYELTDRLKDSAVALVLYDSKGYVALPLTRDIDVLKAMIPSLRPQVIPDVANRLEKGVEQAIRLLKNAGKNTGRILIFTGGTPDVEKSEKLIAENPYQVGVLGVGSETTGTPVIRQNGIFLRDALGNLILAKPDKSVLSRLGTYRSTTPLGKEIDELLSATKPVSVLDKIGKSEGLETLIQPDIWRDLGPYIVLVCLPLMALLFRKGVFYVILFLFLSTTVCSTAEAGFWFRPDQESYRTVKKGNEAYDRGDYQTALKLYEQDSSEEAWYNKGNALAHLKEYYQAIDAYNRVLEKNPEHEDALFNKTYLEQFLKQEQQKSQSQKNNEDQNRSSDEQDSENQNNEENHASSDEKDNQSEKGDDSEQSEKQKNESDKQDKGQSDMNDGSGDENQSHNKNSDSGDSSEGSASLGDDQSNQPDDSDTQMNDMPSDASDKQYSDERDNQSNQNQQHGADNNETSDSSDKSDKIGNNTITETEETVDSDNSDSQLSVVSDGLSSDETDQEIQQIINRLKKDPSQVLKFRLRKQFLAQ